MHFGGQTGSIVADECVIGVGLVPAAQLGGACQRQACLRHLCDPTLVIHPTEQLLEKEDNCEKAVLKA